MLRELQLLEGGRDARGAAGYLCQITGADYKRRLRFLTTSLHLRSRLSLGWPHLKYHHGRLIFRGPLPISRYCGRKHSPLIGITDTDEFQTSTSVALGPKFWDLCVFDHSLETRFNSIRDGGRTDLAPLAAVGIDPLLSVSLASGIGSLRPAHEAWKAGTLTQSMLTDIPGCDSYYKYSSVPVAPHFSLSFVATFEPELSLAGNFGPRSEWHFAGFFWLRCPSFIRSTEYSFAQGQLAYAFE